MQNDITDNERMVMLLTSLSETSEHMKPQQKKEQIKIYGVAAEIFRDDIIPFVNRILNIFAKKIKEKDNDVNAAIAETLGEMVYHIVSSTDTFD